MCLLCYCTSLRLWYKEEDEMSWGLFGPSGLLLRSEWLKLILLALKHPDADANWPAAPDGHVQTLYRYWARVCMCVCVSPQSLTSY